ncbi:MAG: hypothetical protein OXG04_20145 [Acidobacteria bacterium]|nr:hypothetical protein [Acidobacteriota bacterium]
MNAEGRIVTAARWTIGRGDVVHANPADERHTGRDSRGKRPMSEALPARV